MFENAEKRNSHVDIPQIICPILLEPSKTNSA